YFDSLGQGMYHYLTGSASWLVLTQLTQVFGVRGLGGDLVLAPQLLKKEFNAKGMATITCQFGGKPIIVEYHNPKKLDAGLYSIKEVLLNGENINGQVLNKAAVKIERTRILEAKDVHIRVLLDAYKVKV